VQWDAYGITYAPIVSKFWFVFLTIQVELRRVMMMTTPRTMASSCVSSVLNLKPLIMIWEKEPRPDVGRVVQSWMRQ
jgi:hypothetical protein